MSACCNQFPNCSCDCNTTQFTSNLCPRPDPGIQNPASFVATWDYRFQIGRLASQSGGLLVNQLNTSGNGNVQWSLAPQVPFNQYSLGLNLPITGLLFALGANGTMNRITPTADGFLAGRASDGTWSLLPAPTATVPDPLTIGTINVTTENVTNLNVSGPSTFTGVAAGTIATTIGLDSTNKLVSGIGNHTSLAKYFENATETTVTSPNGSPTANQPLVIGNELFDPDGIAHVQNSQTIVIDTAGTYDIGWGGYWPAGGSGNQVGIYLAVNSIGNVVSWGNSSFANTNTNTGAETTGTYMAKFNANDSLYLIAAAARPVRGVGLFLRRTGP